MIAGLVLAAGESRRMGQDKALLSYRGRTFLETILGTLREAGIDRVAVVLGYHAQEIQRAVDLGDAQAVVNRDYKRGQTSSLEAGLEALEASDLEAIVLCLVDHPAVPANVVQALVQRFRESGAPVVIPTFRKQRGHPVLIARPLFEELKKLRPQQGANSVIRHYRATTQFVEVDSAGIVLDVDDAQTYLSLQ